MALHAAEAPGQEKSAAAPSTGDSSGTGSIRGIIRYAADPQKPWRLGRYYIRNSKSGELAEAVVAISKRGLTAPKEKREPVTVIVDQKDFQFTPETSAIRTGDRVRFLNSDNHAHNVKTTHPSHSFNITMPVGTEHAETFSVASGIVEPYRIDCALHSAMRAWVFVFDHPWYQVTAVNGKFDLSNVPAGEYRLDVVHPAGNLRHRQNVVVESGKAIDLDIALKPSSTSG